MRPKILFIGHSYHLVTKSSAFFIEFLKTIGDVTTVFDESGKGQDKSHYVVTAEPYDIVVVWQLTHVIRLFASAERQKNIVFVPMFDAVYKLDNQFWSILKNIKVVSFSSAVHAICLTHQINSFPIQYFPEWVGFSPVGYNVKSLFFWQRRSWPNWQTVTSILPVSQFKKMHIHVVIDPGFEIPPEKMIGPTSSERQDDRLSSSEWFNQPSELFKKLSEFNVFFLPREREGIGMSFLDAMKVGMIPVGIGHATYNEYVVDGVNGFIVNRNQRIDLPSLEIIAEKMKHYFLKGRVNYLRRMNSLSDFINQPIDISVRVESPIQKIAAKLVFKSKKSPLSYPATNRIRSNNVNPLVSVVIRVDCDIDKFLITHRSICQQSFQDFEYIVVSDNPSSRMKVLLESTLTSFDHWIKQNCQKPHQWIAEGALAARGRLMMFMESGDEFVHSDSLLSTLEAAPNTADLLYGHYFRCGESRSHELRLAADVQVFTEALRRGQRGHGWLNEMPCLSAILISRRLILSTQLELLLIDSIGPALLLKSHVEGALCYHANLPISICNAQARYVITDIKIEEQLRKILLLN